MKIKNIIAGLVAAALAVSMTAVSAFAATVELDTEYPGSWGMGKSIPKADLEAVGGDVKVVLNIETKNLLADQFLISPINVVDSWVPLSDEITSDSIVAKQDGWFCIPENSTTVEFVISESTIATLGEGLSFQVQNVTIKSADLTAGSPQGALRRVDDADGKAYCFGTPYEELASGTGAATPATTEAPADAPASDSSTDTANTGNASAGIAVVVMAIAGTVAVTSKKRK